MSKLTELTIDQWHITLQGAANEIFGAVFFKGTLADAKSAAITLRDTIALGRQEITISITSDTYGTASTCVGAQDWKNKEEIEDIDIPDKQPTKRKRKKANLIVCLIVIVFAVVLLQWHFYKNSIKNYQPKDISANCKKWDLFYLVSGKLQSTTLSTEELVASYELCRSDIQAYVLKHQLMMPKDFLMTAEQKKEEIDLIKKQKKEEIDLIKKRKKEEEELAKATVVLGTCPSNWEYVIEKAIHIKLKDPYSAKITIDRPQRHTEWKDGIRYVYDVVPIHINAKNSFGAYVGEQLWLAYFKTGTVLTDIVPQ